MRVNLFSKIDGKPLSNGVVRFYGIVDTVKIIYNISLPEFKVKEGLYSIEVWEVGFNELRTKNIELKGDSKYAINFYLGTKVQF